MSALSITDRGTATGPVVEVTGDLGYPDAGALRRKVESLPLRQGQCLVVDLRGLTFCDSSGITQLIAVRQHALAAGADFVLAAVPAHTVRILRIAGLDQVFTIRPDATSA